MSTHKIEKPSAAAELKKPEIGDIERKDAPRRPVTASGHAGKSPDTILNSAAKGSNSHLASNAEAKPEAKSETKAKLQSAATDSDGQLPNDPQKRSALGRAATLQKQPSEAFGSEDIPKLLGGKTQKLGKAATFKFSEAVSAVISDNSKKDGDTKLDRKSTLKQDAPKDSPQPEQKSTSRSKSIRVAGDHESAEQAMQRKKTAKEPASKPIAGTDKPGNKGAAFQEYKKRLLGKTLADKNDDQSDGTEGEGRSSISTGSYSIQRKARKFDSDEFRKSKFFPKWRVAVSCVLMGIRLNGTLTAITHSNDADVSKECKPASETAQTRDYYFSRKVSKLIQIAELLDPTKQRTPAVLDEMEQLLRSRNKAFATFTLDHRLKLCKIMEYCKFKQGALVCKEGQPAASFYFILSGRLEVFSIKDDEKVRMNILDSGNSLGRLHLLNDVRMANIATLTETELLAVDKRKSSNTDEFNKLSLADAQQLKKEMQPMLQFEPFKSNPQLIDALAPTSKLVTYSSGDTILSEDSPNAMLFWILRGTCECFMNISMVCKKVTNHWTPYNGQQLEDDQEILEKKVIFKDLGEGDFFPGVPLNAPYHQDSGAPFTCTPIGYKIQATSKLMLISMPMHEFLKNVQSDLLMELHPRNIDAPTAQDLQERVMEQRKWEMYKKQVISDRNKK